MPFLAYGPLFVGVDAGIFADHDLAVELVELRSNEATAALARGDVDVVANYVSTGIFNLMARGQRMRIVADKGWVDPDACDANALLARPELVASGALAEVEGMRGRSIHYRPGSVEEYVLDRLLGSAGMKVADVDGRSVPAASRPQALASGALDLAFWSEPYVSQVQATGAAVPWRGARDVEPGLQWAIVLYGASLLDERPAVGERFMAAYLEALRLYGEGKTPANVASLAHHTGLDPEVIRAACWLSMRADGRIDTGSVLAFQRWAAGRGYLDRAVPVEGFWEPRFVAAAAAAGGGR
jgi:ABC-type nitrate/sulfonate/bicarbonate transport system substrate-binding protein